MLPAGATQQRPFDQVVRTTGLEEYDVRWHTGSTPGAVGDGVADDTNAIAGWLAIAAITGAAVILPGPGRYRIKPGVLALANASGVHVRGSGRSATYVDIDDSLGNSGGIGFTMTNTFSCSISKLTFDSTVQRTAGFAIKIVGGNTSADHVIDATICPTNSWTSKVDFNNQFGCMDITDADSGYPGGGWFNNVEDVYVSNPAVNGVCFDIHGWGGQQIFRNVSIFGKSPSTKPLAGIRLRSTGGFQGHLINTFQCQTGFLIDGETAGFGRVQAVQVDNLQIDSSDTYGVRIKTASGALVSGVTFTNLWSATNVGSGGALVAIGDGLVNVDDVTINSGRLIASSSLGVLVNRATNVRLNDVSIEGAVVGGVAVIAASENFQMTGGYIGRYAAAGTTTPIGLTVSADTTSWAISNVNMRDVSGAKIVDNHVQATPAKVSTRIVGTWTGIIVPAAGATVSYAVQAPLSLLVANEAAPQKFPTSQRLAYRLRVVNHDVPTQAFDVVLVKGATEQALKVTVAAGAGAGSIKQDSGVIGNTVFSDGDTFDMKIKYPAGAGNPAVKVTVTLEEIPGLWN